MRLDAFAKVYLQDSAVFIRRKMKKVAVVFIFICFSLVLFADASSKMLKSWSSLSEDEKWFCLLSEPLMEQNKLSITTLNPEKYIPSGKRSVSQSLLEDSWNLFSRGDVLILVEDYRLKQLGHSVTFNKLKGKLNPALQNQTKKTAQNSAAVIEQFAIKECLESYVIARLYFVAEMQDVLGEHGLLAWDYGRILSILRWSIAVGWITEAEALNIAKPFIDELLNAYDSWEDYASHYALGRVFYAFSDGKDYDSYLKAVLNCIKKYDIEVSEDKIDSVFTYHGTKFPGTNRNGSRILTYNDAVFKPSKDAASWIIAVKAETKDSEISSSESRTLNNFLNQKTKIPAAAYLKANLQIRKKAEESIGIIESYGDNLSDKDKKAIAYIYYRFYKKTLKYFDEANPSFKDVESKNELYYRFYIRYSFTAYKIDDKNKMELAISNVDEQHCNVADCQNLYCLYFSEKAKEAGDAQNYKDAIAYAESALFCLKKADSLPSWNIITKEYMQSYEKTLNRMIDEYKYNLRKNISA